MLSGKQINTKMQEGAKEFQNLHNNSLVLNEDSILSEYFVTMMNKIFDPLPVPFILLDKDSRVRMINQVFADYLGFSKKEIIGKPVLEVDKYSRFPYVFKTKKAEIAWKHTMEAYL